MTADDKARELGIKYQTPCHGIGDCEFESYQSAKEMAAWKDEQFEKEKQALIDKACDLFCKAYCNGRLTCPTQISSCASFHKFRKSMEETK